MQKEKFADLIKRYREGRVSDEEKRFLEAYYRSFDVLPDYTPNLSIEDLESLRESIRNGVIPNTRGVKSILIRSNWKLIVAASVILVVSSMFWWLNKPVSQPESVGNSITEATTKANNLIQLPDGSKVILTPGSRLEYSSSFNGKLIREVHLEGEAFFDVVRNLEQPFIVHTGKLKTTVLGTSFNVKAVPGDKSITVTVISGKVHVGDEKQTLAVLLPDEQVVYHVDDARKDVMTVESEEALGWLKGDLYCDDITVGQAALLIEERYGVKVDVSDRELREKRFTTTFSKAEPLESVLNSLALFNDAEYQVDSSGSRIVTVTLNSRGNQVK